MTPAVAARRAAQAQARKAAAALPWDTAYYACTLLQRLWEAHPRVMSEAAVGASGSGGTPTSGTKRRRKAGKAQKHHLAKHMEKLKVLRGGGGKGRKWVREEREARLCGVQGCAMQV